jgi:hypothetical protein
MPTKLKNARPLKGRPLKLNKDQWSQVTCVMRRDMIERLRAGAASKHFGEFLQAHLDRYPPPTREEFLALSKETNYFMLVKRKKVPVIISAGSRSKEAKRLARERARREKMTPEERNQEESFRERMRAIVQEAYADNHP